MTGIFIYPLRFVSTLKSLNFTESQLTKPVNIESPQVDHKRRVAFNWMFNRHRGILETLPCLNYSSKEVETLTEFSLMIAS